MRLDPPHAALEAWPLQHMVHVRGPLRRIDRELHQPCFADLGLSHPLSERVERILFARDAPHDEVTQRFLTRRAGGSPSKRTSKVRLAECGERLRQCIEAA